VFTRQELAAWQGGHPKFSRAPLEDSVLPVIAAGQAELVTNDFALDDQVWLEPTPGHTPDHVAICLASRGQRAVLSGDLMHSPIQCLHPEWTAWPDWDPALAKQTRRAFLERYCGTDTLICTAHFPLPSAGRIVAEGDGFRFVFDDAW
jgi:glyoxylase-like metal-dependent hydrolase (beta-lactamase superfamily II)